MRRPTPIRMIRSKVRGLTSASPLTARALDDVAYRRQLLVALGLAIDIAWAGANIVAGIYFTSVWLITLGAYYLILVTMRGAILRHMRQRDNGKSCDATLVGRLCGALLLLSTLALSGIVRLVMIGEGAFIYEGILVYAVATFAFYSLTIAIVNYARLRKHSNTLVVLNCRVNLSIALVSIFALEVAMLTEFSTPADVEFSYIMRAATGAAIAIMLVILGVAVHVRLIEPISTEAERSAHRLVPVFLSPQAEELQHLHERRSPLRQRVFNLGRDLRILVARYEAVGLQLLQVLGERLVGNTFEIALYLIEAHGLIVHEAVEDHHLVLAAYERERIGVAGIREMRAVDGLRVVDSMLSHEIVPNFQTSTFSFADIVARSSHGV